MLDKDLVNFKNEMSQKSDFQLKWMLTYQNLNPEEFSIITELLKSRETYTE